MFATAPFIGVIGPWTVFGDPATSREIGSLVIAAVGVSFVRGSDHTHDHSHEPVEHHREHTHDDGHHDHTHDVPFEADPSYSQAQSDPHDIAVVILDRAVKGIRPASLPKQNSLSNLVSNQMFTAVGYGAYEVVNGPGGKSYLYNDVRMVAVGTLNSTNPAWLRISMNASLDNGGTCYGDSGGPNFLGDSDTIAATTITGDAVCRSTNVTYRLDTSAARTFLGQYVPLP